ncbi:MAG TPA: hypothetical protein VHV83_22345 [Armatimonadota bacterium]|nr:hypothetical protein [Armatimonadota bacterium]
MTTEQFEQQLHAEAPAVHFLCDTVADYLLNRGHAAKIGEIASQAGKRIGAGAKLIRQALANNPQFVGEERRWNLSVRTLFHRPIEGALQQTLRIYGKPMTIAAFSNEMAVLNARAPEYFQSMLPGFLARRSQSFFRTPDGRWGLVEWLLDTTVTDDEDEMLMRNFFDQLDEVKPIIEKLSSVKLTPEMSATEAALKLIEAAGEPLNTKVLSFLVWKAKGDQFDPLGFYLDMLQNPGFHLLSGSQWMPAQQIPQVTELMVKLSEMADIALGEEEVWEGPYVATPEDLNEIFDFMVEHERPEKLSDLIEAVLEYGRHSPRYESVYTGLNEALQTDDRFQLVGQQTWTLPALIPQEVKQVPEALLPETLDPSLLPDPETDAELEDEGLEDNLALWVHDPRFEDFGGEHEVELAPEMAGGEAALDETRIPLLYDHREMGTLKLRQADMAFFPTDTPLACVTVHGENFGPFQMWINNEELLIHGLVDWYDARDVPVGAILTFRRNEEADDYAISWDGDIDELIALDDDRISTLLDLHDPAEDEHWSIYEIMRKVLAGHPDGEHFLTLWAEINVVRRTPKRVIASNLSSYHCFVQVTGTERWKLDERKVDQGRKKTKKRFIIE